MVRAGVDAFRVNLSHGEREERTRLVEIVHEVREELHRPVAVIADLRGPRLRLGSFEGPLELKRGERFNFRVAKSTKDPQVLPVDYSKFLHDVRKGHRVLLRDGRAELEVLGIEGKNMQCVVRRGAEISSNQGINLPDSEVSAPALSKKDRDDLQWASEIGVDWVALSFVRSAKDLQTLRRALKKVDLPAPVIAKIELPEAIRNLEEILGESNAVMVARGDLAVELGHETVPLMQKRIIRKAREYGVPVATATEMLESMISSEVPTRAEVSDVANAVIDGSGMVMLSGETAIGIDPVQAVRTMNRIVSKAETELYNKKVELPAELKKSGPFASRTETATVTAAITAARQSEAKAVLAFTETGRTARLLSSFRSGIPVVGLTSAVRSFHRMALYWGVRPALLRRFRSSAQMYRNTAAVLDATSWLRSTDLVVALTGTFSESGATNTVRLFAASQLAKPKPKKSTNKSRSSDERP